MPIELHLVRVVGAPVLLEHHAARATRSCSSGASAGSTAAAIEASSSTRWVWMIAKISESLLG